MLVVSCSASEYHVCRPKLDEKEQPAQPRQQSFQYYSSRMMARWQIRCAKPDSAFVFSQLTAAAPALHAQNSVQEGSTIP